MHILSDVKLLHTPSHPRLNIWSGEINGGWPDSRNLKVDGPSDLKLDS